MKVLLTILLGLLAALYGLYLYKFPTYTYRYKVIVDVDVDGKTISGSAVREVRRWEQVFVFSNPFWGSVEGEAVVVDLGSRGLLFATMYLDRSYTNDAMMTPERVFGHSKEITSKIKRVRGVDSTPELWRQLNEFRGCAEMQANEWPLLVRFQDLEEPSSVVRVDRDELESAFGPDVTIRRISICVVDEPITQKIEEVLPWLRTLPYGLLAPIRGTLAGGPGSPFKQQMQSDAFIAHRRD